MPWTTYTDPQQVSEALSSVMADASPVEVQRLARKQGMEVSNLVDNVVYGSAPAASEHPIISAKWLVQFHFDGDRLREIRVRRGLTGP